MQREADDSGECKRWNDWQSQDYDLPRHVSLPWLPRIRTVWVIVEKYWGCCSV